MLLFFAGASNTFYYEPPESYNPSKNPQIKAHKLTGNYHSENISPATHFHLHTYQECMKVNFRVKDWTDSWNIHEEMQNHRNIGKFCIFQKLCTRGNAQQKLTRCVVVRKKSRN